MIDIGSGSYGHRSLAPRAEKPLPPFEAPATIPQLDRLNQFIRDPRIPAPVAYGVKVYVDQKQMTKKMATETLTMLIDYVNREPDNPAQELGLYVDPKTGAFYLLKMSQNNRLYAMDLVINDPGERNEDGTWKVRPRFEWVYHNGGSKAKMLQADWKATPEQVRQWGKIWGHCVKCHAELTRQDSIERSMGKTCWEKQFG